MVLHRGPGFEDLPAEFICPLCRAPKEEFEVVED